MIDKVHILLAGIPLAVAAAWWRHLRHERDPTWELRWLELSEEERERLVDAVIYDEPLDDPEDASLAAGYARLPEENHWFDAPWKRRLATLVAVGSAIALALIVRSWV